MRRSKGSSHDLIDFSFSKATWSEAIPTFFVTVDGMPDTPLRIFECRRLIRLKNVVLDRGKGGGIVSEFGHNQGFLSLAFHHCVMTSIIFRNRL